MPDDLANLAFSNKKILQRKATLAESAVCHWLDELGLKYVFQRVFLFKSKNKCYITDFYIPYYRYVIEIDGAYHFKKSQTLKDIQRTRDLLSRRKLEIIRFTNNQVLNRSKSTKQFLASFFKNPYGRQKRAFKGSIWKREKNY